MKSKILLSVVIVFITSLTFGQKNDYTKYKGYVNFGDLEKFETGEEVTEVIIEEHLLRMVSKMAGKDEPELGVVLDGIKLIKVNTFDVSEENYPKLALIAKDIDKKLMSDGWDRIVKTKSKGEISNVYLKTGNNDEFVGLTVVSVDSGGEAAFVNIVGNIDLETIGKLSDKFDIPSIGDLNKHKNKKSNNNDWERNET